MHSPEASLLLNLMNISSVTGNEDACTAFLFNWLRKNIPHDILETQKVAKRRHNIILKKGKPLITLSSHIDTVPGESKILITNKKIFGRGSCDAKGQIVAQLIALKNAIRAGLKDYACFYVVGEEVDSIGARHIAFNANIGSKYLLNGEPTGNKFVKKSAGILDICLLAKGKRQHTSIIGYKSAIHNLLIDLHALKTSRLRDDINIGLIKGGQTMNVSADEAMAQLSIRIHQNADKVLKKIKKVCKFTSIKAIDPPIDPLVFYVPPEKRNSAIEVRFSSDSQWYRGKFKKIMMFGPGSIIMAHADNENISLKEITKAIDIISKILLKIS